MPRMLEKRSWKEFRGTGLALFVNHFLHIFGWALCFDLDDKGSITNVYPARCKFRGFDSECTEEAYKQIGDYMSENHEQLRDEAYS